jgi:hypothetical protein
LPNLWLPFAVMTTVSPQAQTEFPSAIEKGARLLLLFAVVDADNDDGVGDQPSVLARFIQHLQPALKHVDVAPAVGQRFQNGLLIYRPPASARRWLKYPF